MITDTFNIGDIVFWRDFNYKCTDGRLVTEATLTGGCQRANLIFEGVILGIEDKYSRRGQSFYKVATIQESGGEIQEKPLKSLSKNIEGWYKNDKKIAELEKPNPIIQAGLGNISYILIGGALLLAAIIYSRKNIKK